MSKPFSSLIGIILVPSNGSVEDRAVGITLRDKNGGELDIYVR